MAPTQCMCGGKLIPFDFRIGNEKRGFSSPTVKLSGFLDPIGLGCDNPECKKVYGLSDEYVYEPAMPSQVRRGKRPDQLAWQSRLEAVWMTIAKTLPQWPFVATISHAIITKVNGGEAWEIVDKWVLIGQEHLNGTKIVRSNGSVVTIGAPEPTVETIEPIDSESEEMTDPGILRTSSPLQEWLQTIIDEAENHQWVEDEDADVPFTTKPLQLWDPAAYLLEDHENDDVP